MPTENEGCVVMSIRDHKEYVVLRTTDGDVRIEMRPIGKSKCRVYVRAPRSVLVHRQKKEAELDAGS